MRGRNYAEPFRLRRGPGCCPSCMLEMLLEQEDGESAAPEPAEDDKERVRERKKPGRRPLPEHLPHVKIDAGAQGQFGQSQGTPIWSASIFASQSDNTSLLYTTRLAALVSAGNAGANAVSLGLYST